MRTLLDKAAEPPNKRISDYLREPLEVPVDAGFIPSGCSTVVNRSGINPAPTR